MLGRGVEEIFKKGPKLQADIKKGPKPPKKIKMGSKCMPLIYTPLPPPPFNQSR